MVLIFKVLYLATNNGQQLCKKNNVQKLVIKIFYNDSSYKGTKQDGMKHDLWNTTTATQRQLKFKVVT